MKVLFVTFFVVIIDQVTKLLVKGFSIPFLNINVEGMDYAERIRVLGDFFRLTFVENPGMAFGIDVGISSKLFLSLFSIVASIGIVVYLYHSRKEKFLFRLSLALILGGAIGNLIDRVFYGAIFGYAPLFYGSVVDFFDFDFFNISLFGVSFDRFPIFNIADTAVTIGVIVLILFPKDQLENSEEDSSALPDVLENGAIEVEQSSNSGNGNPSANSTHEKLSNSDQAKINDGESDRQEKI